MKTLYAVCKRRGKAIVWQTEHGWWSPEIRDAVFMSTERFAEGMAYGKGNPYVVALYPIF